MDFVNTAQTFPAILNRLDAQIRYCIEAHKDNKYDGYLPYEYHLRQVAQIAYKHIGYCRLHKQLNLPADVIILGCYAHDLLEDTTVTYDDLVQVLGQDVANIAKACTTSPGVDRDKKFSNEYFQGIVSTPYASIVKISDRIANVQYSKHNSIMSNTKYWMYHREHVRFVSAFGYDPRYPQYFYDNPLYDLIEQLEKIFNIDYSPCR